MNTNYKNELNISEYSYKQAVLIMNLLESTGESIPDVKWLRNQTKNCVLSESSIRRTFGLHLIRFLYKKGLITIGWFTKRRIRSLLKQDTSDSVRLAAFDLLGAILSRTGSKSGVRESDYTTILDFRSKMLERSSKLREYAESGVRADIKQLALNDNTQETLAKIIGNLG